MLQLITFSTLNGGGGPGNRTIGGPRSNPVDFPVDQMKSFFTSKKSPQFRLNM